MSIALEGRLRLLEGRVAALECRKAPDTAPDPRTEVAGPDAPPAPAIPPKRRSNPRKDRTAR